MKRRTKTWALRTSAAILGLAIMTGASGISEEEFRCECAVAHLADCCPDFSAGMMSCRLAMGCGPAGVYPDLSMEESLCLLTRDCKNLISGGYCDAVKNLAATRPCDPNGPCDAGRPLHSVCP